MYLFLFITKPKKTQYKNIHKKHYLNICLHC